MYFNHSTSIIYHGNEQLLSSCGNTIYYWLFLHWSYMWLISFKALFPFVFLLCHTWNMLCMSYGSDDHLDEVTDSSRDERGVSAFIRLRRYFMIELRQMLIYFSLAFVFTWWRDPGTITWILILRWCIEASWMPHLVMGVFGVYIDASTDYLSYFDDPSMSTILFMSKSCLFMWMRYIELYPSSNLNDYLTVFFYKFCDKSHLHHIPDRHRLRHLLKPMWKFNGLGKK